MIPPQSENFLPSPLSIAYWHMFLSPFAVLLFVNNWLFFFVNFYCFAVFVTFCCSKLGCLFPPGLPLPIGQAGQWSSLMTYAANYRQSFSLTYIDKMYYAQEFHIFKQMLFWCLLVIFPAIKISSHLSIWRNEAWLRVKDMDQLLHIWLKRKDIPEHTQLERLYVLRQHVRVHRKPLELLGAVASPSAYPGQWVSQSWIVSDFEYCYRIYQACELV